MVQCPALRIGRARRWFRLVSPSPLTATDVLPVLDGDSTLASCEIGYHNLRTVDSPELISVAWQKPISIRSRFCRSDVEHEAAVGTVIDDENKFVSLEQTQPL
jgi:hypothetical protein